MSQYKFLRWLFYIVELIVLYIISLTPNLIPQISGAKPMLLIPFAICVAMFEGHHSGIIIGIIVGILIDMPSGSSLGFHAIFLVVVCFFVGTFTENLMKTNILNNTVFNAIAIIVITVAHWFFYYVIFNYGSSGYVLINHYLPKALYTLGVSPIIYFINNIFAIRLSDER